jgi:hypothetical protein
MEVEKKIWPKDFEKIKEKDSYMEIRLADFNIDVGDVLVLREWDPTKANYTGKELKFKVKDLKKLDLRKFYSPDEIMKHGIYAMELKKK